MRISDWSSDVCASDLRTGTHPTNRFEESLTIRGKAFIAGAYEHPLRVIPDRTVAQVHADVAVGALADAGLSMSDVDAYFCAGDAPGFGGFSMAEYLGLQLSHIDTTATGGSDRKSAVSGKSVSGRVDLGGRR